MNEVLQQFADTKHRLQCDDNTAAMLVLASALQNREIQRLTVEVDGKPTEIVIDWSKINLPAQNNWVDACNQWGCNNAW